MRGVKTDDSESPAPEVTLRYQEARGLAAGAPEPARVGRVVMGTAGWTDPTLLRSGAFYPSGSLSAQARLEFYARHFDMVEVDATYYALIDPKTTRRWAEWTPETFRFVVKAHPVITGHPIDLSRLPADLRAAFESSVSERGNAEAGGARRVRADRLPEELRHELERRFFDSLRPLEESGKLSAVLAQFPPWFGATRGNARRVESLRTRFPSTLFCVEFRQRSWMDEGRRDKVFALLRDHHFAHVVVDEPPTRIGGLPAVPVVTDERLAVVRFHGRNASGWTKKGATVHERFDYLYAAAELREWLPRVRELGRRAESVHVVFNNCVRDFAVVGAKGLAALLSEEGA